MTAYIEPPQDIKNPEEVRRFFDQLCRLVNSFVTGVWGSGATVVGGQIAGGGTGGILMAPTVTTQALTDITSTSATGNGNITSLGLPDPTQHGVCYSKTTLPTITDNKTEEGAISVTGAFTTAITGLSGGATYYARAYVTNAYGTAYGAEVELTTTALLPPDENLIFHYQFNEATGLVATDEKESFHADLESFVNDDSQWGGGHVSLNSDPSEERINTGGKHVSTFQNPFSFIVDALMVADLASGQALCGLGNNNHAFYVYKLGGRLHVRYEANNNVALWISGATIMAEPYTRKYIIVKINATAITVYIDDVLIAPGADDGDMTGITMADFNYSVNNYSVDVELYVGGNSLNAYPATPGLGAYWCWGGNLYRSRLYNKDLTAAEMTGLFNTDT
jgi:hypothetical protein